jgi:hypothetical protein
MFEALLLWGCLTGKFPPFLNEYQADPVERMQTLMYESENVRQMQGEIDRFWMVDQPSHVTQLRNKLPASALLGGIAFDDEKAQQRHEKLEDDRQFWGDWAYKPDCVLGLEPSSAPEKRSFKEPLEKAQFLAPPVYPRALLLEDRAKHGSEEPPVQRMQTLMYEKDGGGQMMPPNEGWFSDCWLWMHDQSSHLTPDRTHGGVR